MDEDIRFDWDSLVMLLPLCFDYYREWEQGNAIDIDDAMNQIGKAFGCEDLQSFVAQKAADALAEGFSSALGEDDSQKLAGLFVGMGKGVLPILMKYAKGDVDRTDVFSQLNRVCFDGAGQLQDVLKKSLNISDSAADRLASHCGGYIISIFCLMASYKIYQSASRDAALAKEHRIEIEQLCNENIAAIKKQKDEMEQWLSTTHMNRLLVFKNGTSVIDQAVIEDDNDSFILGNNELCALFGKKLQYQNTKEFDELMASSDAFKF